jgi:cytochrome c-type biogenesis protein CcmH
VATLAVAVVTIALAAGGLDAQQAARHVEEPTLYEIAAQLRCVVCQNLSVADSPSEMARQMRDLIRERLAAGESPAEVIAYFVDKYGEWVLLEPRRSGFTLLVWIVPLGAAMAGMGLVAMVVRGWTRRAAQAPPVPAIDPGVRERIRRELEAGS